MAGLTQYKSMRDQQDDTGDEPISPMDAYARSLNSKGNVNPGNPKHANLIENVRMAALTGQLSERGLNNIVKYNPSLAPILFTAYSDYQSRQQNGYSRFFDPGRPEIGTPGTGGSGDYSEPPTDASPDYQPEIAPKADYERALLAALARGDKPMIDAIQKQTSPDGGKLYGGVQYAQDPKTGAFVPFSIDPNTRQAVRIEPPPGTVATVPMMPQQVMYPGGASAIVQIPSRGVPGAGGGPKPSGLIPAHPASMDAAGKIAMLNQASSDIDQANSLIFKDGKFDRGLVAKMNVPLTAGVGGDARIAYSAIHNAVAAKLRAETGAAANRDEVENIARRFMPTVLDDDNSAKNKMDRLKQFMESAVDVVDPNKLYGRGSSPVPANSPGAGVSPAKQRLKKLLSE